MFSICTCTVSIISQVAETDLNLVRTFLRLYETRSVTRTAEQMSLTQPSVSHALRGYESSSTTTYSVAHRAV